MVHFVRCAARKRHVRTRLVVPDLEIRQFLAHLPVAQRDQEDSCAKPLQRQDEPFQDGNTAVLAHGAEPRPNAPSFAPAFESATPELRALVANQILGSCASVVDGAAQKRSHGFAGWNVLEHGKAHESSRIVVQHDGDPPAEWPALGHGKRQP